MSKEIEETIRDACLNWFEEQDWFTVDRSDYSFKVDGSWYLVKGLVDEIIKELKATGVRLDGQV